MNLRQVLLTAALVLTAILWLRSALRKNRDRKNREFTRKLETVLQPKETVKAQCATRQGRWVLTSKRLLLETPGGFTAVPLAQIRRVTGQTKEGKKTTVPDKMETLTVKAAQEYTLHRRDEDFAELAKQLTAKVKKQNEKKTGKGKSNEKK